MRWILRIFSGLVVMAIVGVAVLYIARPFEPPVESASPGETGVRIEEDGMIANYFPALSDSQNPPEKNPAILILGGSEGGLGIGAYYMAIGLQKEGFSVLQLSYYRLDGQPKDFFNVPLETFDKGLDWLKAQPNIDPSRIGIFGTSKGAEAALITASRRSDVRATVLGAPTSAVWAGFSWVFGGINSRPSWHLDDEPYPYLPYGRPESSGGWYYSGYANGLLSLDEHRDAIIKVENANGPVLALCGEKDTLWPACKMARQIETRAKEKGGPLVEVLAYPEAGHVSVGVPFDPTLIPAEIFERWGGTLEANMAAMTDGWSKIVRFLTENL